jgi:hypothetical protein
VATDGVGAGAVLSKGQRGLEKKFANEKAAFHKAEIEKWWPIIKSANIKAE